MRIGVASRPRPVNALVGRAGLPLLWAMAPFTLLPGSAPLLFLCDHASGALPPEYGDLGLEPGLFASHIARDIGAAAVTRAWAAHFKAPAVLAAWSRLLIDFNRGEDDPTLVMKLSDGSIIPGNRDVDAAETARRIAAYHGPYHAAIAGEIVRLGSPSLFSVHSFTPVWKGTARPWEIGILWDRDDRLAAPLMRLLRGAGFTVGDNEPYSGALENDTLNRHGTKAGLPHVLIEIRQDLIGDDGVAKTFAARLAPLLAAGLAEMQEKNS
jgi:predicted N-formylglutamate amidohydrolase